VSNRSFSMRLQCTYTGNTNTVDTLEVEHKLANQWQQLDLGITSPGFDIFVYAVFACQHMYFRVNCAERGLVLGSAEGNIHIVTGQDWDMQTLQVNFSGQLDSGEVNPGDIDYIISRMQQCPVSRNLKEIRDYKSTVVLA
jgi:hypothetical protein